MRGKGGETETPACPRLEWKKAVTLHTRGTAVCSRIPADAVGEIKAVSTLPPYYTEGFFFVVVFNKK